MAVGLAEDIASVVEMSGLGGWIRRAAIVVSLTITTGRAQQLSPPNPPCGDKPPADQSCGPKTKKEGVDSQPGAPKPPEIE
jgi:hypothetical protein